MPIVYLADFFFPHYAECVIRLHQSHCCLQITSMHLSSPPTVCQPPAALSAPQHSQYVCRHETEQPHLL